MSLYFSADDDVYDEDDPYWKVIMVAMTAANKRNVAFHATHYAREEVVEMSGGRILMIFSRTVSVVKLEWGMGHDDDANEDEDDDKAGGGGNSSSTETKDDHERNRNVLWHQQLVIDVGAVDETHSASQAHLRWRTQTRNYPVYVLYENILVCREMDILR